jgi:hypothetical protein
MTKATNYNTKLNKATNPTVIGRVKRIERYISNHSGDLKAKSQATSFVPPIIGTVNYLSDVSQGDNLETRTGLVINAHHFTLGVLFKMSKDCSVRVVIVRDTMQNGALPVTSDILDSADVVSPLNYQNTVAQKRFMVIDDYTKHFTVGGTLTAHNRTRHKYEHKIRWKNDSGASASALSNNIYAVVITNVADAGQVSLYTRLEYTDE